MKITINVPNDRIKNGEDLHALLTKIGQDFRCEKLEVLNSGNEVLDLESPGTPRICTVRVEP